MLAARNPHLRDALLSFEPGEHKYTVAGRGGDRSVTTAIAKCFPAFDADEVIRGMMTSARWDQSKYYGLSPDQIKRLWREKGETAAAEGTKMHEAIEDHFNGCPGAIDRLGECERRQFAAFLDRLPETLEPYRTEWAIWDDELGLAGTVDMVFKNENGEFLIYDWKRTPKIERSNSWGKTATAEGLEHLPDSNFWKYGLQLNVYKTMLEKTYGAKVAALRLVCFHPERVSHEVVPIPFLTEEAMVAMRRGLV